MPVEIHARTIVRGEQKLILSAARDIIERKRAEEKLLKEKQLSDNIIDSLPGVFYCFSERGPFRRWNANFQQVSGYSPAEFAELTPLDLFTDANKNLIGQAIREVFLRGTNSVEAELMTKDGLRIPYFFTGRHFDLDGIPCVLGMGIDLTQRKQAEEAFEVLVNHAPIGLYIVQAGKFQLVNPGFEQITGYSAGELLGRESLSLVTPNYQEAVQKNSVAMIKGELNSAYEFSIITKSDEIKW